MDKRLSNTKNTRDTFDDVGKHISRRDRGQARGETRQWNAGSLATYIPQPFIGISFGVFAIVSPPVRGVILYQVHDLRLTVVVLAAYYATQIKTDVAAATLLNTLAPVN